MTGEEKKGGANESDFPPSLLSALNKKPKTDFDEERARRDRFRELQRRLEEDQKKALNKP